MPLNAFRDEAGAFLSAVDPTGPEPVTEDEEIPGLKASLDEPDNPDRLSHQVTDVLFLPFELAARKGLDLDLDRERARARDRKRSYAGD